MIIKKFKLGEEIPEGAKFIKCETTKENHRESNHTWCGCPDLLNCNCATWDNVQYFYYEIPAKKIGSEYHGPC